LVDFTQKREIVFTQKLAKILEKKESLRKKLVLVRKNKLLQIYTPCLDSQSRNKKSTLKKKFNVK